VSDKPRERQAVRAGCFQQRHEVHQLGHVLAVGHAPERGEARGKSSSFKTIARVGEEAPDFSLPTPEGEYVRLSEFRGRKYVLLEFGSIT
jgi:hypothetical protein